MSPRFARRLLMLAYACSGVAGLVYQVTWTRMMVLLVGHTTAAITTVVAGFMAGLAVGSLVGTKLITRVRPGRALAVYAALELAVAGYALLCPAALRLLKPALATAYQDGDVNLAFGLLRTVTCLCAVFIPACLLGATFLAALRALSADEGGERSGGRLYTANTAGAAVGALLSGFLLLPSLGLFLTTVFGVMMSVAAACAALWAESRGGIGAAPAPPASSLPRRPRSRSSHAVPSAPHHEPLSYAGVTAAIILTGFAGLLYEVAWTRAVASLLGPTTYAFAGTVSVVILGLAMGGALGSALAPRSRARQLLLAVSLALTAAIVWWTNRVLGDAIPSWLAMSFAASASDLNWSLLLKMASIFLFVFPAAIGFGMTMPLALGLAGAGPDGARRSGLLYGLSAGSGVFGALVAPIAFQRLGIEGTLNVVPVALLFAAVFSVTTIRTLAMMWRTLSATTLAAAAVFVVASPSQWDRELLASGLYKYSHSISPDLDVPTILKAGDLRYYRDGQVATVSVITFAGKMSLAVDGKVDGSTGGDMLTQELAAHIPMLLHERPDDVLVIGLGTGVTAASAATHPAQRIDVVEISPEVVEASALFADVNHQVLADPRVRLLVGDGRSHLSLSRRQYDVIISEPSNPWLAGVAALFTEETFLDVRARLAPGGIACQWLHTYDISESDFRSIVGTFTSVFPEATLWNVGDTDMLLVSATGALSDRLMNIERGFNRDAVRRDLARVGALEPFSITSLWAGGSATLQRLGADSPHQTDDRMALEFTAPRAAYRKTGSNQAGLVRALQDEADIPHLVRRSVAAASAPEWRHRAEMFEKMGVFAAAYADYGRAVTDDESDALALRGLATTAVAAGQQQSALRTLTALRRKHPQSVPVRVALSRLMASMGQIESAIGWVVDVDAAVDEQPALLDQLAALYADAGATTLLEPIVDAMKRLHADGQKTLYYKASLDFSRADFLPALEAARAASSADPEDADVHNLLGAILASLGRKDEAKQAFDNALRHAPADASIYVNLGLLALERQAGREAVKYFAGALALDPSNDTARRGLLRASASVTPVTE